MAARRKAIAFFENVPKVRLRIFVDFQKNRVLYAEADKDFVDALFSFLTLPLGTIARLVMAKDSNTIPVSFFGSISSLYQSVAGFNEDNLWTATCKEMLLKPRNSMEDYCRKVKLNIDNTDPLQYFRCKSWDCNRRESGSLLSTFRNQKCSCGEVMETPVFPKTLNLEENGFVKEVASFIISDDLRVMPNLLETTASLLRNLGYQNTYGIQVQNLEITKKEVIDLLKYSLVYKTPLTAFYFRYLLFVGPPPRGNFGIQIGNTVSSDDINEGREMTVKVMVRKSNGFFLFAEAEEDFVDFLFSFLTFPLGGVLHMLEGFSSLSCLNNLYESVKELSPDRYLISQDLKDKLVKPNIASQFDLTNQILPVGAAASLPVYYCHTYFNGEFRYDILDDMVNPEVSDYVVPKCVPFSFVDPKSSSSKASNPGEFAKGPRTYMVLDNLFVGLMSSPYAMSCINGLNIPLFDLEEKVIKIGVKEGLAILKASLTSPNALTIGLHLRKQAEKK